MAERIGPRKCPYHSKKSLQKKVYKNTYKCQKCQMYGKGKCYRCEECDYVVHSQCMNPLKKITPNFLQGSEFKFLRQPLPTPRPCSKRYCDACGMTVKGNVYHCYKKDLDLHPCCASLQTHLAIDGERLTLHKRKTPEICDLCRDECIKGKIDNGWFYAPRNNAYKFHVLCIMNNVTIDRDMDLAKLKSLPVVKHRRRGIDGGKYWKILKTVFSFVVAIIGGNPAHIILVGGVQVVKLLAS